MDVFLIEDNNLLEKYDTAWVKISFNIEKESDSEPLYNKKKIRKSKPNLTVIKQQVFTIKRFLRWALIILV